MVLHAPLLHRLALTILICTLAPAGGCKKSAPQDPPGAMAMGPADVKRDGTLTPEAMQKIESKAGESAVSIIFVRCQISDAALLQLAKVPNLRRIEAIGSRLTPGAIEKFKQALPQAEIVK